MWDGGFQDYVHDWWNLMDFVMNSLYLATISLKIVAYTKVTTSVDNRQAVTFLYAQVIFSFSFFCSSSTAEVNPETSGKCGTQH